MLVLGGARTIALHQHQLALVRLVRLVHVGPALAAVDRGRLGEPDLFHRPATQHQRWWCLCVPPILAATAGHMPARHSREACGAEGGREGAGEGRSPQADLTWM